MNPGSHVPRSTMLARAPHTEAVNTPANFEQEVIEAMNSVRGIVLDCESPETPDTALDAIVRFKDSNKFETFRQETIQALRTLYSLANPNAAATDYHGSAWWHLEQRLQLEHLTLHDQARSDNLRQLYELSCTSLRSMAAMASVARAHQRVLPLVQKNELEALLKNLEQGITACGPGIVQNIEETLTELRYLLAPPSLKDQFAREFNNTLRHLITEFVNQHFRWHFNFYGNHIHMVTAIQNHLSRDFDIAYVDDKYASSNYVDDVRDHLPHLIDQIHQHLEPDRQGIRMAQGILDRLGQMSAIKSRARSTSSMWFNLVNRYMELIRPRYGSISPNLLSRNNSGDIPIGPAFSPFPLAIELLQRAEVPLRTQHQTGPETVDTFAPMPFGAKLMQFGQLVWIEEKQGLKIEPRAIQISDLVLQENPCEQSLSTTTVRILYEALRNLDVPETQFFRRIDFQHLVDSKQFDVLNPVLVATLETLPEQTATTRHYLKELRSKLNPFRITRCLLSPASQYLTLWQQELLLTQPGVAECPVKIHSAELRFSVIASLEPFKHVPSTHPNARALFKWAIQNTPHALLPMEKLVNDFALMDDDFYINHLMEVMPDCPHLQPERVWELLANALESGARSGHLWVRMSMMTNRMRDANVLQTPGQHPITRIAAMPLPDQHANLLIGSLLKKGLQWRAQPHSNVSPLRSLILTRGRTQCLTTVLRHANRNIQAIDATNIWCALADRLRTEQCDHVDLIPMLWQMLHTPGIMGISGQHATPMIFAAAARHPRLFEQMIQWNLCPSITDANGRNALHHIAMHGRPNRSEIERLVEHGVYSVADQHNLLPEHLADWQGDFETANMLRHLSHRPRSR